MPTPPADLLEAARADADRTVDLRRRLHRHPEIGLHLPRTQAAVLDELAALPVEVTVGRSTTSAVGVLRGARPGPTYLLRADMDALPVQEDTGLPFASEVPGAMHACGHDLHVAMLLGAARLLAERRDELAGQVVLMLQPGEEGFHGARAMLEEGLLDVVPGAPVSGAFALHVFADQPGGVVSVRPGPMMAAADHWLVTVRGRGGHASMPHAAADPVPVAAEIVLALQSAVTRRVPVFDPAVVTVAHLAAGSTNNVIPDTAFLEGTIRTLSASRRVDVVAAVRRVATHVAAAHDLAVDFEHREGYPVTVNDAAAAERVRAVAGALLGAERSVAAGEPLMGAEDFAYVLARVPGAIAFLGACPPGQDPQAAAANHSNRVVFDEAVLPTGAALHAAMALAALAT
ncbi:amidohydrolase [Geodermatophilus sp. TF02-6]|uniref:M20 metallopeptidase family protein n=1 Tax=Geodermatophilus sp. TF02-6 TaxID=2250575 RepID=UPI000DE872F4|nr:M20 family metallopeptidase [Geodermatophilus sp. TF02-6]RBY82462.1 amidohydrolase [Geodermatophilus sp. TF02-6]